MTPAQHTAPAHFCPTCGGEIASDLSTIIATSGLTTSERRVAEIVLRTPMLLRRDVADKLYADDPDGGPLSAETCVARFVCNVNPKIAAHGWKITGQDGSQGYRFVRTDGLTVLEGQDA